MNAERLLGLYEKIADAPDAVARLRRFVLDLAVRGKLVPQDASDKPAAELLKRIAREKARLVESGEIRKSKSLTSIDGHAVFDLPANWRWTRLEAVTSYIQRGKSPTYSEEDGSPVISQKCVQWRGLDLSAARRVTLGSLASYEEIRFLRDGDLLWNSTGTGTIGRIIRLTAPPDKLVCDSHVTVVRCLNINSEYIRIWLQSDHVFGIIEGRAAGSTNQVELTAQMAVNQVVPLPPLPEQHRIVAKVDELMRLCDRLEAARAGREAVRDRLAAASLARLGAPDPETFQADARYILDALPTLTARADQIKALRQTILNLAVRGKLVPQDTKDSESPLPPLRQFAAASGMDDEVFDQFKGSVVLPSKWQIAPLAQLASNIVDCPHTTPKWTKTGEICIRTSQLRPRILDLSEPRYVSSDAYLKRIERLEPKADDILYSREGGILGIACRVPPNTRLCLGQRLMLIRADTVIRADFLEMVLNSPLITDIAKARTTGGAAPRVNMSTVRAYPIPLPPLVEQHRIVAKVDALMALCDRLEASLSATVATRGRLLDALLAEALAPSNDRAEAPVTERGSEAVLVRPRITPEAAKERSAFILMLAFERHRSARRDWSFGHVKAEKILHLVEAEADYDLGRAPIRAAAGPADFPLLVTVEKWAQEHRRFAVEKIGKGYTYKPLADFQKSLVAANDINAATRARIEKIIALFIPMDMGEAEVIATVYAAWNNLLIEGKIPTDDDIIRAAREDWHPQKLKIPRAKFADALRHLRSSEFVPSGRGKFVHSSQQQDLFPKR